MVASGLRINPANRNFTEANDNMAIQLRLGVAFAMTGALMLSGCSKSSTSPSPSSNTVTVNVVGSIGNQAFQPNPIPAPAGDTVVFKNSSTDTHHIVLDDGSADLGQLAPGATTSGVSVKNSNQVLFHCTIHPSMVGSVNGQNAPVPPPCVDPYGVMCGG
jgi:plastocyanin